jgi:hypothetical protein
MLPVIVVLAKVVVYEGKPHAAAQQLNRACFSRTLRKRPVKITRPRSNFFPTVSVKKHRDRARTIGRLRNTRQP